MDGGDTVKRQMLKIMNQVFTSKRPPKAWLITKMVPIPKKGDLTKVANHRGIALMSAVAKLYNRCILNRLRECMENLLSDYQAGFRRGRSTREQIHILRRLIEGADDKRLELAITFVDFAKAFDSLYRPYMWAVLRAYGVPHDIVEAIKCLYTGNVCQIKLPNQTLSREVPIETGVLQGGTLVPYFIIVVLDYALSKTRLPGFGFVTHKATSNRRGLRSGSHESKVIHDLAFADDIALIDTIPQQADAHLKSLEQATQPTGLRISSAKTEWMRVGTCAEGKIQLQGHPINNVKVFKYLGSMIPATPDPMEDFRHRYRKATNVFWTLSKVWRAKISLKLKYNLWRATVVSILGYGAETWVLTPYILKRCDTFQRRSLRIMLGIHWEEHVTTDELWKRVKAEMKAPESLSETLSQRQKRWLGHVLRSSHSTIKQYALWEPTHGKRKQGHPRTSFLQAYRKHTHTQHTEPQLRQMALDREI